MYDPKAIERRWQETWLRERAFSPPPVPRGRPKYYILDMFPYPSGKGLHVGHLKGYVASDVVARYKRMRGYEVLHPMGWDSFGLPTERQAQLEGISPVEVTSRNVLAFKEQLQAVGLSYDWSRELSTSDPDYYRWTQWIFCKLYEHGLAYTEEVPVNWCPALNTVLANEEVFDGRYVETGDLVERRRMRQWVLRITAYADRLLEDLEEVDWPEPIKLMQRNWIGRSPGALIRFPVVGQSDPIEVFTTRPDTIYGTSYLAIAPEHRLVDDLLRDAHCSDELREFVERTRQLSDVQRQERAGGAPSGVPTGLEVINPVNRLRVPVWVCDYLVAGYGSGAVMGVPAHDSRDFAFATASGLPVRNVVCSDSFHALQWLTTEADGVGGAASGQIDVARRFVHHVDAHGIEPSGYAAALASVVEDETVGRHLAEGSPPEESSSAFDAYTQTARFVRAVGQPGDLREQVAGFQLPAAYVDRGRCINSGSGKVDLDGLSTEEAKVAVIRWLEASDNGGRHISYKLKDWLFSRQRYWGEPIPVVHGPDGSMRTIEPDHLPVLLPPIEIDGAPAHKASVVESAPSSPLDQAPESWRVVEIDNESWQRETNTMPQWAGSCWYYLRFLDPINSTQLVSGEVESSWMPVDLYVGGAEHATLHLLYARFWHKFLYDIGVVTHKEPFSRLFNQGMVHSQSFKDSRGRYYYQHQVEKRGDEYVVAETGETLLVQIEKMSKSKCNGVPIEEVIEGFGADALRLYEMFIGPVEDNTLWDSAGLRGTRRFLDRVWRLFERSRQDADMPSELERQLHRTIRSVTGAIEALSLNTAVSDFMALLNEASRYGSLPPAFFGTFARLLQPFAPHVAEELWHQLGHIGLVSHADWPTYDAELCLTEKATFAIQVNGKMRGTVSAAGDADESEVLELARGIDTVSRQLDQGPPTRTIFVPGRILNLVY